VVCFQYVLFVCSIIISMQCKGGGSIIRAIDWMHRIASGLIHAGDTRAAAWLGNAGVWGAVLVWVGLLTVVHGQ